MKREIAIYVLTILTIIYTCWQAIMFLAEPHNTFSLGNLLGNLPVFTPMIALAAGWVGETKQKFFVFYTVTFAVCFLVTFAAFFYYMGFGSW